MYRESDLQNCLYGLAGWRQNQNPDYEILPPSLIQSSTGLYFQDVHPLVDIENLDQALKNFAKWNYPAYTTGATYAQGDRTRYAGDEKVYEATVAVPVAPSVPDGNFVEVKLFSQKLEALTKAAINKVANKVFNQKKLRGVTKAIFENVLLYSGVGDLMNKEVKQGRFVGFKIKIKSQRDVALQISRISTQFSLANPSFRLFVFSLSNEEPIRVIEMNLGANVPSWKVVDDFFFRWISGTTQPGDEIAIGYYENDLQGQAIKKAYNFGAAPQCSTCNADHFYYTNWSPWIDVMPFYVSAENLVGILPDYTDPDNPILPKLWDINVMQPVYSNTFGLNMDISVKCDLTDFLCGERSLFTDVIMKQVAVDAIGEIAFNTRNNTISKETIDHAHWVLQGDKDVSGLRKELQDAIDGLDFDLSNLNSSCLPCNNGRGITYTSY